MPYDPSYLFTGIPPLGGDAPVRRSRKETDAMLDFLLNLPNPLKKPLIPTSPSNAVPGRDPAIGTLVRFFEDQFGPVNAGALGVPATPTPDPYDPSSTRQRTPDTWLDPVAQREREAAIARPLGDDASIGKHPFGSSGITIEDDPEHPKAKKYEKMWNRMNDRFPYTKDLKGRYEDLLAGGQLPKDVNYLKYLEDLHRRFRRRNETSLPFHEFALRGGVPAQTLMDEVKKTGLVANNYILRDGLREIRGDRNYKLPKEINTIAEYALQAPSFGFWDEIKAVGLAGAEVVRGDSDDFWKSFHRNHGEISEDMRKMLQRHPEMILAEMLLSGGRAGVANLAKLGPKSLSELKTLKDIKRFAKEKLGDAGIEAVKSGVYTAGKAEGSVRDRGDEFLLGATGSLSSLGLSVLGRSVARQIVGDPLDRIIGEALTRFFRPAIYPAFAEKNEDEKEK